MFCPRNLSGLPGVEQCLHMKQNVTGPCVTTFHGEAFLISSLPVSFSPPVLLVPVKQGSSVSLPPSSFHHSPCEFRKAVVQGGVPEPPGCRESDRRSRNDQGLALSWDLGDGTEWKSSMIMQRLMSHCRTYLYCSTCLSKTGRPWGQESVFPEPGVPSETSPKWHQ